MLPAFLVQYGGRAMRQSTVGAVPNAMWQAAFQLAFGFGYRVPDPASEGDMWAKTDEMMTALVEPGLFTASYVNEFSSMAKLNSPR